MIYWRGKTLWFKFKWNGQAIYKSARTKNRKVATDIESAYRTALAKGEVGIKDYGVTCPTLLNFQNRFFGQLAIA